MKRIIAVFSVLVMLVGLIPQFAFAEKKSDVLYAEAILGEALKSEGFSYVAPGSNIAPQVTEKDGVKAWLMDRNQGTEKNSINFILSPEFKHTEKDGSVYEIEIEYYDTGTGFFDVYYDSYTEDKVNAITVGCKKESRWKKVNIVLSDAEFGEKCNGSYDFFLTITKPKGTTPLSSESIAIKSVKVTRYVAKNPIYVTPQIDETGNTYRWYSENKIIHNTYENLTDQKQVVNVTHSLISDDYVKPFSKMERIELEPREKKDIDLNFGEVKECNLYWYNIDIKSDDGSINSTFRPLELAIVKTDPDGIKNDIYWAAHLDRYGDKAMIEGVEMIENSNAKGYRSGFEWGWMVNWGSNYIAYDINDELKKRNLEYSPIVSLVHPRNAYDSVKYYVDTPEDLAELKEHAKTLANLLGENAGYEIANEPNLASFNPFMNQGVDVGAKKYVDAMQAAYEGIKSVHPDAQVGGPVLCYINNEKGIDFFDKAMEYGMWKYMDAFVVHAYANNYIEKADFEKYYDYYTSEFAKVGKPDIKYWNTETGFTVTDKTIRTKRRQGILNATSGIYYSATGIFDRIVIYNLEQKGEVETEREDNFGCVSPGYTELKKYGKNFVPTISYVIVTGMNYMMAESETVEHKLINNDTVSINRFKSKKFNKDMVAFYSVDWNSKNITLDLGVKEIEVYDEYANPKKMTSENGIYTISSTEAPTYVLGDFEKFEVLEENPYVEISDFSIEAAAGDEFRVNLPNFDESRYEIETDTPLCVQEVGYSKEEKALVLKNNATIDSEYNFEIKIKENGNIVQKSRIFVKSLQPVEASITAEMTNPDNLNRWKGIMNIKNYTTAAAKGYIEFKNPTNFTTVGKVNIGTIPAGTTGKVEFNMPEIKQKGEYTLDYNVVLNNGVISNFSNKIDFTLASFAKPKPQIDGVVNKGEWSNDTLMYADKAGQVIYLADMTRKGEAWKGINDLSAKACIEWDENNMYLMIEVTDDVFSQEYPYTQCWNGDSVQFGIFYGDEVQVALGQKYTTFHEICLSLNPDGEHVYRTLAQDNAIEKGEVTKDCDIAIQRVNNKTCYELKMPWKVLLLEGQQPKADDRLGFSFLVNDNDGTGRKGWIEYASGIGSGKNTELFTYLRLLK